MKTQPQLIVFPRTLLIGKKLTMSLTENKTQALWQSFMPLRNAIQNRMHDRLLSMQVYDNDYFTTFNPARTFDKYAVAEVSNVDSTPEGLDTFVLPEGLYAVFHYKGSSNNPQIFNYIFGEWIPASDYTIDDRPHFEILDHRYKNNDPESEEEICIPVRKRNG